MSAMFAGLDVHSKQTFWAVQSADGQVVAETVCDTTPQALVQTIRRLNLPPGTRVGLESGGQARWISHVLTKANLVAEVLSPQEIRAKVHRRGQKTDRRDALEICDGLRRDQYVSRVWIPTEDICRLRRILSRRRHFIGIRTAQVNAVKGLLKTEPGMAIPVSLGSHQAWQRLIERYGESELGSAIEMHHRMWELAHNNVKELDAQLQEGFGPFREESDLLMSAPGVGPITAGTFIAVVGDANRFPESGRLASYAGLTPSVHDSGQTQRHGSITKQGSTALRSALCEAAQHARKPTHPLNPYFLRIKAIGGYKKAVIAVAHRLLRILYQMWKRREPFKVEKLNVHFEPQTMSWTSYYHLGAGGKQRGKKHSVA